MNPAVMVALMHAVLVARPSSPVFHIYAGPLTPSGRFAPAAARTACRAHTRRLFVIPRIGVTVDLGGRRMCARCSARLSAVARRAEQPVSRDDRVKAFSTVTLGDLATATAIATTVDETHAIATVASLIHGPMHPSTTRRPAELSKRQARYDLEVEIIRRRRELAAAERTPEEIEAAAAKREAEAIRDARILAQRAKDARVNRAMDRRLAQKYEMPHEKALLDSA